MFLRFIPGFLCLALFACNAGHKKIVKTFENRQWLYADSLSLSEFIPDTGSTYRISLEVTLTDDYPFSNIFIHQRLKLPNDSLFVHIQEIEVLNPDGTRKLKPGLFGNASIHYTLLPEFKFQHTGVCELSLKQYMRTDTLSGVEKLSWALERVE